MPINVKLTKFNNFNNILFSLLFTFILPKNMKNMEKITLDAMRNFIVENELTDSVAITLHPDSFDELVLEYLDTNGNQIERPFEILGIEILQDTTGSVPVNKVNLLDTVE